MSPPKVLVITNIRSYHQVDLFDAIAARGACNIRVLYLLEMTPGRLWQRLPEPKHDHARVPVYFGNTRIFYNPSMIREIKNFRPDIAIICQYVGLSNPVAMLTLSSMHVPWVFWSESPGVRFFEVKSVLSDWARALGRHVMLRAIGYGANEVWAIGPQAVDNYTKGTGLSARRFPYFSNLKRFQRDRTDTGKQIGILFAGRYSFRKGFDTYLNVLERLAVSHRSANWTAVTCGDGELKMLLERVSPEVRSRVSNIGFRELNEMPDIYNEHDVLLCPSRYDGWGMVIPEALAAGVIVLSTSAMGSALDIGPRPGHVLFDPDDEKGMAEMLGELISNPSSIILRRRDAIEAAKQYDAQCGAALFENYVLELFERSACRSIESPNGD
ncbi:MAG TPA: glycosyltransferase family 4 protein [Polyangiaceae bacterium]|jgi:glycosyltransferase involved in cell wall biosynthesis|nr:glycosyltransferase family 4 protein [Polyangiaceae bacterium]HQK16074.1 glycosyltransferase family 4 protein [Polyangiaceae bacterium]